MKTVIFDLDGTLANIEHRVHHVRGGNRRWDLFHAECVNDTPIGPVVSFLQLIQEAQRWKIILVSGRSDIVRTETETWLRDNFIYYNELIMRKDGDYTPDDKLKEQILDNLLASGHDILFTVDDRQRVVDMWRRRGIVCLQAAAWEEEPKVKSP